MALLSKSINKGDIFCPFSVEALIIQHDQQSVCLCVVSNYKTSIVQNYIRLSTSFSAQSSLVPKLSRNMTSSTG